MDAPDTRRSRRGPHGVLLGAGYTAEEVEFLMAVDAYKRTRRRPCPTWAEVLAVARSCGWRKVAEPGPLPGYAGERGELWRR